MKHAAELKQDQRDRMRSAGFVLKQIWAHPGDWKDLHKLVRRYIDRRLKGRKDVK